MPLATTVVGGECADDPLYVPEIRKVQACLQRHGVLHVGDCKMAALNTRAYVAAHHDHYLRPLPGRADAEGGAGSLARAGGWAVQPLIPVYRPAEKETDEPEHLANGFSYTVKLSADCRRQAR